MHKDYKNLLIKKKSQIDVDICKIYNGVVFKVFFCIKGKCCIFKIIEFWAQLKYISVDKSGRKS